MSGKPGKGAGASVASTHEEEEANASGEEIEEEIYVTDDEDGSTGSGDDNADEAEEEVEEEEVEESAVDVQPTPVKTKPAKKSEGKKADGKKKVVGKVTPSESVKNMKMASPERPKKPQERGLNPSKSPFAAYGNWTPKTLGEIEIAFPVLTGKDETTNDLTRNTRPEARYWKAPITFKFNSFTSENIRVNGVQVPFHTGKGYGSNYVYLCLPGFMADAFGEAGKKRAPTKVNETSLVPDGQRWWKIANKVGDSFGIIRDKKFVTMSLDTIFEATRAGITCSMVLNFKSKASTGDKEPLRPTTARTVSVEVVRAYILQTDTDVQMPTRINREKTKVAPVASSDDVATDSLLGRLAELGL